MLTMNAPRRQDAWRRLIRWSAVGVIAACAAPAPARPAFDQYEYIIAREPFGAVARKPTAAEIAARNRKPEVPPPPVKPPEWPQNLRLVAVIEPDGDEAMRVGLYDQKLKKSYWIDVGETHVYHVVKVSFKKEIALIERDERRYWFSMDRDLQPYEDGAESPWGGASLSETAAAKVRPKIRSRRTPARWARPGGAPRPLLTREDFQMMKHVLPAPVSASDMADRAKGKTASPTSMPPGMTQGEMEEYFKEYQMELIRAGGASGPALPIPLTPEMDAQLVEEGVLAPME